MVRLTIAGELSARRALEEPSWWHSPGLAKVDKLHSPRGGTMDAPFTLSFEEFWNWLVAHPNCILRAGTPEAAVYDHEAMHWSFSTEGADGRLVQLVKGKQLVGEILVSSELVTYVQGVPADVEDEFVFELVSEGESDRRVFYFFVMAHSYEEEDSAGDGQVH